MWPLLTRLDGDHDHKDNLIDRQAGQLVSVSLWKIQRKKEELVSEKKTIDRTGPPLTVASLTEQLRACGLAAGQTVLVHMAMSKLGWIIGGAQAVILALG
jgi:hypothetical protein